MLTVIPCASLTFRRIDAEAPLASKITIWIATVTQAERATVRPDLLAHAATDCVVGEAKLAVC